MLFAESAILVHFQSVRIVFLIFNRVIISLLAFRAGKCDFYTHIRHLLFCLPDYIIG